MKKLLPFGVLILFLIVSCQQSKETKKREFEEILEQLDQHTHALESPLPTSSLSDLSPLNRVSNSKIVALGEATHGTKEFFQLKHKIFRYLVEVHDFRIFAFEADMGEAVYINNYIQGGEGDIAQIMAEKMLFWTWKTKEVKALLDWMRSFNEGTPVNERIYFIGLDTQHLTYQPTLIEQYIERVKPEMLKESQAVLNNIQKVTTESRQRTRNNYQEMPKKEQEVISDTLDYLMQKMRAVEDELIKASSNIEYKTMHQLVRNLQQSHEHLYATQKQENQNLRDKYMAENAIWASQLFGENNKIAVWAHNGHISELKSGFIPMGYHLNKKIGDDYTSIAFSFNKGTFTAVGFDTTSNKTTGIGFHTIASPPLKESINHLFALISKDNFILDLDSLDSNSDLESWLAKEQLIFQIGAIYNGNLNAYYRPLVLMESYDFVIHIDSTSHSVSVL